MKVSNTIYYVCSSCTEFKREIQGSRGDTYIVTHGFNHRHRDVLLDFACTCPSYHYRKGKDRYCKHIREVQKNKEFCGWDQCVDGGEPVDGKCPRCGLKVDELPMY